MGKAVKVFESRKSQVLIMSFPLCMKGV